MRLDTKYTRVKLPRWAAETSPEDSPPDLGQVSELIRNTLTTEYDIYPPNLSTEINDDGSIQITAVNPTTKLNIQVTLQNLAGDLIHPEGQLTGVVPPAGGPGGEMEGEAAGGLPAPPPAAPTAPGGV